jgi:EmrB/QacA subfamily drug resistance transporter
MDGAGAALESRRRHLILLILCSSLLMIGLDSTIVNIALPAIHQDLHTSVSGLQWTIDAYLLGLASLLMLSGSMGDRFGRRRVFEAGLLVFTASSFCCSLAPNLGFLIAFRMLQGIGASMTNPVAMSIVTNTFTEPRERARAIGIWGAVGGISVALGPIVGGLLVTSVGWRSVFWINIPVGIAGFILTRRFVPDSRAAHPRRIDPVGQVLVIVFLGALTFGIIESPNYGITSPIILASLALAGAALIALLLYERRREEPLLDVRFFRSMPFSGAVVIAMFLFAAFGGFLFMASLYLQEVRRLNALHAGIAMIPIAVAMVVFALVAGRMTGRRGSRIPFVIGGAAFAMSGAMMTGVTDTTSYWWLMVVFFLFGVGMGIVNPPITVTAVSGMPMSQAGVAAGLASTSRQVGQSLGVAVVGALTTVSFRGTLPSQLAQATHPAWWVVAFCGVMILTLGLLSTSKLAQRSARRIATSLLPEAPLAEAGH